MNTDFASAIESSVPIIVQYTRLDSRQAEMLCSVPSHTRPVIDSMSEDPEINRIEVSVYKILWTLLNQMEASSGRTPRRWLSRHSLGNQKGIGYTFADTATGQLIKDKLSPLLVGADAMAVPASWLSMVRSIRNLRARKLSRRRFHQWMWRSGKPASP